MQKPKGVAYVFSDTHWGHILSPVSSIWWLPANTILGQIQRATNARYRFVPKHSILIFNGDIIEGDHQGGSTNSLLIPSIEDQIAEAVSNILSLEPYQVIMTYGTPFHSEIRRANGTVVVANAEDEIVYRLRNSHTIPGGVSIGESQKIVFTSPLGNRTFKFKHKISNARHLKTMRTAMDNFMNYDLSKAERIEYEKEHADVCIASHHHIWDIVGTLGSDGCGIYTPAMRYPSTMEGPPQHCGYLVIRVAQTVAQEKQLRGNSPVVISGANHGRKAAYSVDAVLLNLAMYQKRIIRI